MKRFQVIASGIGVLVALLFSHTAFGQVLPRVEIGAGYGFERDFGALGNAHGWRASIAGNLDTVAGFEVLASGSYRTVPGFTVEDFFTTVNSTTLTVTTPGTPAIPGTPGAPPSTVRVCPSPNASPRACKLQVIPGTPGTPGIPGTEPTESTLTAVTETGHVVSRSVPPEAVAVHSLLLGPRFAYRANPRVTPWAHSLFGVVHGTSDGTSVGVLLGGGVDFWTGRSLGVRLGADYQWTGETLSQDALALTVGLAWRGGL
jgi:hypothetical protein